MFYDNAKLFPPCLKVLPCVIKNSEPIFYNTHTHTHTHTYIYIYIYIYIYKIFQRLSFKIYTVHYSNQKSKIKLEIDFIHSTFLLHHDCNFHIF